MCDIFVRWCDAIRACTLIGLCIMWQFVNSIFAKILRDDIALALPFDIYAMKISLIQSTYERQRECHIYFHCADGYDGNRHSNRFILSWNLDAKLFKASQSGAHSPAIFNRLCILFCVRLCNVLVVIVVVVLVAVIFRAINWGWRYFFFSRWKHAWPIFEINCIRLEFVSFYFGRCFTHFVWLANNSC